MPKEKVTQRVKDDSKAKATEEANEKVAVERKSNGAEVETPPIPPETLDTLHAAGVPVVYHGDGQEERSVQEQYPVPAVPQEEQLPPPRWQPMPRQMRFM